ncbi:MAG: hypothetical protein F4X22_13805, partial [Gemmatimonadales bacterium]|nr:hypothetical protein [Candidatus Palauibacter denitrificans]
MRAATFPLLISGLLVSPGFAAAQTLPAAAGAGTSASGFAVSITLVGEDVLVSRNGAEIRLPTYPEAGAAYVFRRGGAGSAVAVAADAAFLGAPGGLGDLPRFGQPAPAQPGAVYVYAVGPDGEATMAARLASPSPEGADRFGAALAAVGDLLIVGAPGSDGGRGAVYRFERDGDAWRPGGAFVLEGLAAGARFGTSLALEGNTLFAGAPGQAGGGIVAAFDVSQPAGASRLVSPPEGSGATGFGASLAVGGGMLWVGAPGTAAGAGAAYAIDRTSLDHVQSVDAAPFGPGGAFGSSLGAGAEMTVVGAGQADLRLGAAAVLERSGADGSWVASGTLRDPERPNMTAVSGETVSCQDGTALDYACTDVDLVAFLPLAQLGAGPTSIANDIWGWTDPETGREYVLLGKSNGTSFVDI